MKLCSDQENARRMEVMLRRDPGSAEKMTYDEIAEFTNNFSEENLIGTFQFGKIYHGRYFYSQYEKIMVKTWQVSKTCKYNQGANLIRVMNEVMLVQHEKMIDYPGLEFLGFCWNGEHLSVAYNYAPMDSIHNLVPKDTFTWLKRIKVALEIARLLKFFHAGTSKFLVRNIAATHILVDEEYNPKLCDFGMIVGGIFPNEPMYKYDGCYGYVDPNVAFSGEWSEKMDVFAFGVLLLNLITKRVDIKSNAPLLYVWAWDQFESHESESCSGKSLVSLVDESLAIDSSFSLNDGYEITNLAMKCVNKVVNARPTMKQVVKSLLKLEIVKANLSFWD